MASVDYAWSIELGQELTASEAHGMHCRNISMIFSGAIPTFKAPLIWTSSCGSHPPAVRRLANVIISRSCKEMGLLSVCEGTSHL